MTFILLTTYAQQAVLPTFQELLPQQTIYLAGMTKFVCTGLRIAYLVFRFFAKK